MTYLLAGRMEHRDSRGNQGSIGPGDVQWMTAGAGVVHSEMPDRELLRSGGPLHGFQLWVNLPRRDKMVAPRYQEIPAARIPTGRTPDRRAWVRPLVGEALGVHSVVETRTSIAVLHVGIESEAAMSLPLPAEHNALAYVIRGSGWFDASSTAARAGQAVVYAGDGDGVSVSNPSHEAALELLLLAGAPIGEPIVRHGPFVMNSREEILRAIEDFHSGRMGAIVSS
jgi:redox-sensitive bicupin YhaK (pirin superfamily)